MNANENHAAAGVAATTDRAEEKAEWWKKPIALHTAIATGIILVALIINFIFEFNFFWKLLMGGTLVWFGTMLAGSKTSPVSLWGKIIRGLGYVILVMAILNSGIRLILEQAVVKTEQALTQVATTGTIETLGTLSGAASAPSVPGGDPVYTELDFRPAKIGDSLDIKMSFNTIAVVKLRSANVAKDGDVYLWVCPGTTLPAKLPFQPKFEVVAGAYTTQNHVALTQESKLALLENGTPAITVRFTHMKGATSPCMHLKTS